MHREVTTVYSQAEGRELCRAGWRAVRPISQEIINGPDRETRTTLCGEIKDGFSALMVRDIHEDTQ